jgi:CMP-N-acetylneuraminic acid synthetase|tara:strand:+ start:4197 stop:4757 length:561 start_codon:yes stop_codon:yes gene_type:complete
MIEHPTGSITYELLTIIPAKMDSKRLTKKNLRLLDDKPLLLHSLDYAKKTNHINKIIVSSESSEVSDVLPSDIIFHDRNLKLCGDVEVVDVYLDVIRNIHEEFDYVVCLQPDNPTRSNSLDDCLNYMIDNKYDDLITVNNEYKRSGSVRIFKYEYLKAGLVSKRMGCIRDSAIDIHYKEDLEALND